MLFLLIQLGKDLYALDAREITEVVPMVRIKTIPQAPHGIAGAIQFRGAPVPVVDLGLLTLGEPTRQALSTRIVLANYRAAGPDRLLGLMAAKATDTIRREPEEFTATG